MKNTIRLCINDVFHGDPTALMGLLDHLVTKGYSVKRIIDIAERHFKIPRDLSMVTLMSLV